MYHWVCQDDLYYLFPNILLYGTCQIVDYTFESMQTILQARIVI